MKNIFMIALLVVGCSGPAGSSGRDGRDGTSIAGKDGTNSAPGPKGDQGDAGANGETGATGSVSPIYKVTSMGTAVSGTASTTAKCNQSDVVIGGGCAFGVFNANAKFIYEAPEMNYGWTCTAFSNDATDNNTVVIATVLCETQQ